MRVWLAERPLITAVLAAIGVWLLLQLLGHALWAVVLVLVALVLAAAMMPIVRFLRRPRFPPRGWRLPRAAAVLVIYALLAGLFAFLGYRVASLLLADIMELARGGPGIGQDLVRRFEEATGLRGVLPPGDEMVERALAVASASWQEWVGNLANLLFRLLLALVLALFLVVEAERLLAFCVSLFPPHQRARARQVAEDVGDKMGRWLLGFVVRGAILGVLGLAAAWLIGLPYAMLIGFGTGVLALLPVVGPIFMVPPVFLLGLGQSTGTALLAAGVFLALEQIDAHVLGPVVMGRAIHLSPTLIIVAIAFGLALYGPVGALLSIPLLAALQVITCEVFLPWLRMQQTTTTPAGPE